MTIVTSRVDTFFPFQQRYAPKEHAAPNEVSKRGDSKSVLPEVLSMNLSPGTPELEQQNGQTNRYTADLTVADSRQAARLDKVWRLRRGLPRLLV